MIVFIEDNGASFGASELECLPVMLALAAGDLAEKDLAGWLRTRIRPTPKPRRPAKAVPRKRG